MTWEPNPLPAEFFQEAIRKLKRDKNLPRSKAIQLPAPSEREEGEYIVFAIDCAQGYLAFSINEYYFPGECPETSLGVFLNIQEVAKFLGIHTKQIRSNLLYSRPFWSSRFKCYIDVRLWDAWKRNEELKNASTNRP